MTTGIIRLDPHANVSDPSGTQTFLRGSVLGRGARCRAVVFFGGRVIREFGRSENHRHSAGMRVRDRLLHAKAWDRGYGGASGA